MRQVISKAVRGLIGVACVALCAGFVFFITDDVEAAWDKPGITAQPTMPTARDLTVFERRLHRASETSPLADTCAMGSLLGGSEIHVATKVPGQGHMATRTYPDFARADVERVPGEPKALILESLKPTLWKVTGSPSVIIVLGEAVVAEYPTGVPIFAPKFVEGCAAARWVPTPKTLKSSLRSTFISSLIADPHSQFANRAKQVSQGLFGRDVTSWAAQSTDALMQF